MLYKIEQDHPLVVSTKLIDFGLARRRFAIGSESEAASSSEYCSGIFLLHSHFECICLLQLGSRNYKVDKWKRKVAELTHTTRNVSPILISMLQRFVPGFSKALPRSLLDNATTCFADAAQVIDETNPSFAHKSDVWAAGILILWWVYIYIFSAPATDLILLQANAFLGM